MSVNYCFDEFISKNVFILRITFLKATIKQVAELKVGILTQCLKSRTLENKGKDPTTIRNILQKINAKLNGVNHSFMTEKYTNLFFTKIIDHFSSIFIFKHLLVDIIIREIRAYAPAFPQSYFLTLSSNKKLRTTVPKFCY